MKTYDPHCLALADLFLRDEPVADDKQTYRDYCIDLALAIQKTIDGWMADPSVVPRVTRNLARRALVD